MKPIRTISLALMLAAVLSGWSPSPRPTLERMTTAKGTTRWIEIADIGIEILNLKREIVLSAARVDRIFKKGFPRIEPDWQLQIGEKIEPDQNARDLSAEFTQKWLRIPEQHPELAPHAVVLRFSQDEAVIAVLKLRGWHLWHHYYDCLALFRVSRDEFIDAVFAIAQLDRTYGATYMGLQQGDDVSAAQKILGEPDATVGTQAVGYFDCYYFQIDRTITFKDNRIQKIAIGVPAEIKAEAKKKGKYWDR